MPISEQELREMIPVLAIERLAHHGPIDSDGYPSEEAEEGGAQDSCAPC